MKTCRSSHANSESRRKTIVDAALSCFVQKGYTETGISEICRKAKASTGSVYHHFKSKSGLAVAVYLSGIHDYQDGMLTVLVQRTGARDGIYALIDYHLRWVERYPDWARFLFQHRHAEFMAAKETEDAMKQLNDCFAGGMSAWFKKQMDAGRIRKLPRDIFFALLLGACQEYARQYLAGCVVTDVARAVEQIAAGVWSALKPDM